LPEALLEVDGLSVRYGAVRANQDISIRVPAGRLAGIIGANGAGKTTFIDAITGFIPLYSGAVRFDGTDITTARPDVRARQGLVRTFQTLELFDDLSVWNNLMAAAETSPVHKGQAGVMAERAAWSLETVGLTGTEDRLTRDLSHGQRKLVTIARGLAAHPKLLLLDEPAAGLDASESLELGRMLRRLVADGLTILMIDHDMGLVLSVCDHVIAFDFGQLIAEGSPSEMRTDTAVIAAYLGAPADPSTADLSRSL
jgi:branched-chain amino acid transport system ATP-binding protein